MSMCLVLRVKGVCLCRNVNSGYMNGIIHWLKPMIYNLHGILRDFFGNILYLAKYEYLMLKRNT